MCTIVKMPWTSPEYQKRSLGGNYVAEEIRNGTMLYAENKKSKPLVKNYTIKSKIDTAQIVTNYNNTQGPLY